MRVSALAFRPGDPRYSDVVETVFVCLAGSGLGVVLQRLLPAYHGLVSLLELNVKMAKTEAISHDRTLRDAIRDQGSRMTGVEPYHLDS